MTVRYNGLIALALALLVIEGAIVPWLVPAAWSARLLPHLCLIVTLFAAGYGGRVPAFFLGLGLGLLQDVLSYGDLIGAYGFGMSLIGYLAALLSFGRPYSLPTYAWVTLSAGLLLDSIVYYIYRLFGLTNLDFSFVFVEQIAPTAIVQLLAALVLYVPMRRWLTKAAPSAGEESSE